MPGKKRKQSAGAKSTRPSGKRRAVDAKSGHTADGRVIVPPASGVADIALAAAKARPGEGFGSQDIEDAVAKLNREMVSDEQLPVYRAYLEDLADGRRFADRRAFDQRCVQLRKVYKVAPRKAQLAFLHQKLIESGEIPPEDEREVIFAQSASASANSNSSSSSSSSSNSASSSSRAKRSYSMADAASASSSSGDAKPSFGLSKFLVCKSMRSLSGVLVVTVFTSPYPSGVDPDTGETHNQVGVYCFFI